MVKLTISIELCCSSLLIRNNNSKVEMDEAKRNSNIEEIKQEDIEEEDDDDEKDDELLKIRISTHPLYGRLVENHLNCLKVGGIGDSGRNSETNQRKHDYNPCSSMLNQSELDLFMEAYCSALSKLKEAMEEPQQETIAFINGMHSQLKELARTNPQSADVFLATEMNNSNWSMDQQK